MQEHSLVEFYVNIDGNQRYTVEQTISSSDLETIIVRTLHAAGVVQPVTLTLLITDDDGICAMNTHYRHQNKPTDVLSFPLLDQPLVDAPAEQLWETQATDEHVEDVPVPAFVTPPDMPTNLGDIVISWPAIVRQAEEAGHSITYELLYLLAHGVLHLIGYDDHSEAGYQAMVRLQQSVLQASGLKV